MQKQKKQFLVLAAVLVLFVAAYFAVSSYAKSEQEKDSDTEVSIPVAEVDVDQVEAFSYMVEGNTYFYEKRGENWICEDDTSLTLDGDSLEATETTEDTETMENGD